jgi:hypothetical protein
MTITTSILKLAKYSIIKNVKPAGRLASSSTDKPSLFTPYDEEQADIDKSKQQNIVRVPLAALLPKKYREKSISATTVGVLDANTGPDKSFVQKLAELTGDKLTEDNIQRVKSNSKEKDDNSKEKIPSLITR